jgi:hypothetical protein
MRTHFMNLSSRVGPALGALLALLLLYSCSPGSAAGQPVASIVPPSVELSATSCDCAETRK